MFTNTPLNRANQSSTYLVNATNASQKNDHREKQDSSTLEFKLMPSVERLNKSEEQLTGTYNNQGKLGLISNSVIVYVQPSAFIRDKLVPSYKVV